MFRFQQFALSQERSAMKVGTDGILLGAWAPLPTAISGQPLRLLDVGTGTGLIALMLAQRLTAQNAIIYGIEPDAEAAAEASQNAQNSPWAERINIFPVSLQTHRTSFVYDVIVCNPPFFTANQPTSAHENRALARHETDFSAEMLFQRARELLHLTGKVCCILPVDRGGHYQQVAQRHGFTLCRQTFVRHSEQHPVKRVLLCFSREAVDLLSETLVLKQQVNQQWQDTPEFAALVQDFYLRFAL